MKGGTPVPASIRDVAQRAGVSVGTVSNVLNRPEEVSTDSVDRVNRAIEELGYVRNDAARKLRAGSARRWASSCWTARTRSTRMSCAAPRTRAPRHNIAILYGNTDEDHAREKVYLDLFEEQQVRGVLIAPYDRLFFLGAAVGHVDRRDAQPATGRGDRAGLGRGVRGREPRLVGQPAHDVVQPDLGQQRHPVPAALAVVRDRVAALGQGLDQCGVPCLVGQLGLLKAHHVGARSSSHGSSRGSRVRAEFTFHVAKRTGGTLLLTSLYGHRTKERDDAPAHA